MTRPVLLLQLAAACLACSEAGVGSTGLDADSGQSYALLEPPAADFPFPVFETSGAPLRARPGVWTYREFADTRCRDGSRAGISLRLNPASKKVLIYLEGGVYCFDAFTCALNPANVEDWLFNSARIAPATGIFDTRNAQNPVRDWNVVYVPYCTGDAMGGTRTTPVDVPGGPSRQYFSGHLNLQKFLQRVVPTFPDATDVLLVGMSAGGSSVLQNAVLVQRAFPKLKVRHVNDSSLPPASKAVLAGCLQDKLRTLWDLDQSSLAYCGTSCPKRDEYWQDNALFLAELFADRPSGFIDAIEDDMMRAVCGLGARDCTGNLLFDGVDAATYRRELLAYRDQLSAYPNYGTFLPEGTQHTFVKDASFYTATAGGVKLVDWFASIANGVSPGHAGP
ncbi:MAG TPA: pectin acetylesterase-family hydrolase [Polyangiales bacterium]|nr:pectin acetylesterase-family hydrolase [Polyangiales bacterium]